MADREIMSRYNLFRIFGLALALWTAILLASLWGAVHQPWLGVSMTPGSGQTNLRVTAVWPNGPAAGILDPGDVITALAPAEGHFLPFEQLDLVDDPDLLPTFARLNAFFDRQDRLARALRSPLTRLQLSDGREVTIRPHSSRPLEALPHRFWVFHAYGGIALLVGTWIWVTARFRRPAHLLLASGLSFLALNAILAVIVSREIALPGGTFSGLQAIYHFANNAFSLLLLALLWQYPATLRWRTGYWLTVTWVLLAWLNERFQWHDLPGHNVGFQVALLTLTGLAAIAGQWRASRARPADRAVVRFLIGTVVTLDTLAVAFYYHAHWLLDKPVLPLEIALGLVTAIYLSLVIGVLRYRLFDLDRLWLYLWVWLAAGMAILGLDFLISAALPWLSRYSLVVALFFIGWIYFPIREWLWSRIFPAPSLVSLTRQLPQLILSLVNVQKADPDAEWNGLLIEAFKPLNATPATSSAGRPRLLAAGEKLYVPGIRKAGLELSFACHGRRLFTPKDVEVIGVMHDAVTSLDQQLQQYRKGVTQERARIMRDLHDDVGGRLLTLVHECEGRRVSHIAREALDALREVVYFNLDAEALIELPDAAGRWRHRIRERLEQQGVRLDWNWLIDEKDETILSATHLHNIGRVLQEAVNNALKHARPEIIQISGRRTGERFRIEICNDGVPAGTATAQPAPTAGDGKGMHNMRRRAHELDGDISVERTDSRYRLVLEFPLDPPRTKEV